MRQVGNPLGLKTTKAKAPHVRVLGAHAVQLGGFKTFLGQIIGLAELLISLILGLVTNVDLVVSRVRTEPQFKVPCPSPRSETALQAFWSLFSAAAAFLSVLIV